MNAEIEISNEKKVKHQVTVKVFDDDSVEYEFEGVDGWPAGKMERQLGRAGRYLRREQRVISQLQMRLQAEKDQEIADRRLREEAELRDVKNLSSKLNQAVTSGGAITMADVLKSQLAKLENKDGVTGDDTGRDGEDAGGTGQESESNDGQSGSVSNSDDSGANKQPGNSDGSNSGNV